jgi:hypothetical protein
MYNEKLHGVQPSSNFIMVINSRRLVWHVACIMEIRNTYKVLIGKSEEMGN